MNLLRTILLPILFCLSLNSLTAQDLYDLYSVKDIKITFLEEDWAFKLDSLKDLGNDDRLLADVNVNGKNYKNVGVRYKGNSSYFSTKKIDSSKLPFNLKANFKDKEQTFEGGYKSLKLSNVYRDPSYVREVLAYEIAGTYMPAPRANFIRLYVNDTYLGLYNNTESVDEKFLEKHYGAGKNILIKCDPLWNAKVPASCTQKEKIASLQYLGQDTACYFPFYEMKSDSGWIELQELTRVLEEDMDSIENVLDVDRTLWMHAFNNALVNLDSYTGKLCHNYYIYQTPSGQFTPIVWDMNLNFGAFEYDGVKQTALTNEELQTLSPFVHFKQKNEQRPLITKLLNVPLYRKIYVAHLKTIVQEYLQTGKYLDRAKAIQEQIDFYVKNDENKLYTYEEFRKNLHSTAKAGRSSVIGISELMSKRTQYLSNHALFKKEAPQVSNVQHQEIKEDKQLKISALVTAADKVWLSYRNSPNEAFQRVLMEQDSQVKSSTTTGGKWTTTLPYITGLQYYIIGESKLTATVDPARAAFEFYEVK